MKKILAIILTLAIILAAIPFTAIPVAAGTITSGTTGDCTWTLDGTVLTISGNGEMADYGNDDEPYGSPWSESITKVIFEDGVTNIGIGAFYYCTSLTSVTIPDSVTRIGNYAFQGCTPLASITIPDSVTSIGFMAFYDTTWYNNQPNGLVYAGKVAYKYKGICPESVIIKKGTISISPHAFHNCNSLTSITIPDSVTSVGDYAFYYCTSLTSITIPDSVTSIGYGAFGSCDSLTSITIPDSVTSIGSLAFHNTVWYNNQPDGLVYAGKVAYEYKGICPGTVTIKEGTVGIADYAFYDCSSLTSITIPDSVKSIGDYAFYGCDSLSSITIPDSVTSIGESAFYICSKLTLITIPDNVTNIGRSAFAHCSSLTSVTIGDSVTSIGGWAFSDCSSLTSVTIPDSVTSIGLYAFSRCSSLTDVYYKGTSEDRAKITIGSNNTELTNATWHYDSCIGAAEHTYDNDYDAICNICNFIREIIVPDYYTYTVTDGEATITDVDTYISGDIIIPSALGGYPVTSIGDRAFYDCDSITSIIIPDSVTSIGDYAFYNCSSLTSITIPESVTSIGNNAFEICYSLEYITIPDSVTSIGAGAFMECSFLTSVTIPDGVTSIKGSTFLGCGSLTSITIPDSVTSIESEAFYNCYSLKSITIPDSVTSIGYLAFYNCYSLNSITVAENNKNYSSKDGVLFNKNKTELICYPSSKTAINYTIPNSVTSIEDYAFSDCLKLTSITIPDSVTSIGSSAFVYCHALASVTIPDSVTSIGNYAFYDCYSLKYVYYEGNESNKARISIEGGNEILTDATWYYNSCIGSAEHTYDNACDRICNVCEFKREVPDHVFDSDYDGDCNECGFSYYTYTVTDGEATITDVDTSISGDIVIPSTLGGYPVTTIGKSAFNSCSLLTSITIPDSVISIGSGAFGNCQHITSVTIPKSVTSIGSSAFSNCLALTRVNITDIAAWCGIEFGTLASSNPLYYAKNLYLNGELVTDLIIPDNVTSIGKHAFYGCTSIESITIPNSVVSIGATAFSKCTSLTSVTIGNGVKNIEARAFQDCSALSGVYITDISAWCNISFGISTDFTPSSNPLYYAKNLYLNGKLVTDLVIPDGISEIKEYAFYNCSSLSSITIPDSVISISSAFYHCDLLEKVYYRGSKEDSAKISIEQGNGTTFLTNATWYYNSCIGSAEHSYGDNGICAVCGYKMPFIYGDCNGDNKVNTIDFATLRLHLAGFKNLSDIGMLGADLNSDGIVDITDLAKLKLKLAGIE